MTDSNPTVDRNIHTQLGQRDSAYGWLVVALTFFSTFIVLGSRFSIGMFLPHIPQAVGATVLDVSGVVAMSMIGAAIVQPLSGVILDRWGGRVVMSLGLSAAGIALCGTAFSSALWQLMLFMGVMNAIGYAAISPVSMTSIVASWFDRRRGAALGVATSGTKLAMVILPPVIATVTGLISWQAAMIGMGLFCICLIVPVLAFLRPAPTDDTSSRTSKLQSESVAGKSLHEALWMPAFWCLAFTLFANGLVMNLTFIHLPNYILAAGYPDHLAATGLSILGVLGLFGTIATGVISDRVGRRNVMLVMFSTRALSLIMIILFPGPIPLFIFLIVFGLLGYGALGVIGAMGPELFGRRRLGLIMSIAYVFNQLGAATGVYIGGISLEITGNYDSALWVSATLTILSLKGILMIRGGENPRLIHCPDR